MKIPAYKKRLTSKLIAETAAVYPVEIRENFVWLAEYLRDECRAEMDLLEMQIHDLGLPTTGSTISKMICGLWNRRLDDDGNWQPLDTPIISLRTFNSLVSRLRAQAKLKRVQGKVEFVETSAWRSICDYIEVRRAENSICKIGLILGPTGSQKGACEQHYCHLNNHGTCRYIESPDSPSMSKFIRSVSRTFAVPQYYSLSRQLVEIEDSINKTRTLIFANIQRLYRPNAGWYQPVFNWIQTTQERSGCTMILEAAVSSDFAAALRAGREQGYFEQFIGRCGGEFLILPDYPPEEDLCAIAASFGLNLDKSGLKLFEKIARREGRVRTLFHILQKAVRLAGKQKLTLNAVREAVGLLHEEDDESPSARSLQTEVRDVLSTPPRRQITPNLITA